MGLQTNIIPTKKEGPRFFIEKDTWKKVISYAESSYHQFKAEIGGQLVVIQDDEGDFILKEPVILKQEVTGGNCTMEAEALALHYSKMVNLYGDKVRHCWWHSHHTMGAFWSGTDDATIMENRTNDFSLSLVVNLKEEYKLRVQFFYPIEHEENVTLHFLEDETIRDNNIDKEVKQLCSVPTYTVPVHNYKIKNSNQSTLWTKEEQKEVDDFNYGWQLPSVIDDKQDAFDYREDLDVSLIPLDKREAISDLIEGAQDKMLEHETTYEEWLVIAQTINDSLEKYNLKVKSLNKDILMQKAMEWWPVDFLENINGGTNFAN